MKIWDDKKGEEEKKTYIDDVLIWVGPVFKTAVARFAVGKVMIGHHLVTYRAFYLISKFRSNVLGVSLLFMM